VPKAVTDRTLTNTNRAGRRGGGGATTPTASAVVLWDNGAWETLNLALHPGGTAVPRGLAPG
jgi:hypothetical protein